MGREKGDLFGERGKGNKGKREMLELRRKEKFVGKGKFRKEELEKGKTDGGIGGGEEKKEKKR
jgi:hypothetical protein